MAKKIFSKRTLALVLALTLCFSLIQITAYADGRGGGRGGRDDGGRGSSSSEYEWYEVYVNGILVASDQGEAGDIGWLVRGVYEWDVSISGTTMYWSAGNHSGTVELSSYIQIPEGYEIREDGVTIEHSSVTGDNSQADQFDNAIITVTIEVLYDQETGETIPVEPIPTEPEPTEPEPTEPEPTEPEPTEPEPTEPEPTEPEPTEPEPTEPEPTEPEPTEPEPTEPEPTEPEPTEPEPTEPEPTEPEPTEPEPTEPEPTEPEPTDPEVTDPEETEPETTEELVDIPDEEVPLAEPPKTGDPMVLYAVMTALSGSGLLALGLKKKKEE